MKGQDFRTGIIPRRLKNNDYNDEVMKEYDTTDLIYLDSDREQFYDGILTDLDRRVSATDHAKIHNVYLNDNYQTKVGTPSSMWCLRSAANRYSVYYVKNDR